MPIFKLNRNFTLRSLYGHIINFKKDVPVYVPPILVNECVHIGAEQTDGTPDVLGAEDVAVVALTYDERAARIFEALEKLVARNNREDFTASGLPQLKALERETGFSVDVNDRDTLWRKRREALAGE
jgi:hypothetical protein